ncbi:MAG: HlyD family efflux transporter periplasmic adaptor subunit [Bacteroidota bacterium]|nr:HlyD family efflux transporter periplasmic adaptor subunit [Bacteroidota bacterium]
MENNKPLKTEIGKLRLQNNEINDIIGIVPKWFVRFGITIIFIFLMIILIGCWFFKYPDIVSGKVQITANNIPSSIVAHSDGRIEKIFIRDNQHVNENEILAVIESNADYKEVFAIKNLTDSLNSIFQFKDTIFSGITYDYFKLGEIQPYYSSFIKQLSDYNNFVFLNYQRKKIASLNFEISQENSYIKKLNKKLYYSKEQLSIARSQFRRDSLLYKHEVIALADFEKSRTTYLQSKSTLENVNTEIINANIQVTKLNQDILDLSSQRLEQTTQQHNNLKESYEVLLSHISDWEKTYILKSTTDGIMTFTRIWNKNQNVKKGDVVFTIIPSGSISYIAKIQLPIQSSGKVKVGQKVIIKLDDFPYMEYGMLCGFVNKISLVPDNDFYFAEVNFSSKLLTTYGKDISMKSLYNGSCEIITQEQRLIYKLVYPLRAFWVKNRTL